MTVICPECSEILTSHAGRGHRYYHMVTIRNGWPSPATQNHPCSRVNEAFDATTEAPTVTEPSRGIRYRVKKQNGADLLDIEFNLTPDEFLAFVQTAGKLFGIETYLPRLVEAFEQMAKADVLRAEAMKISAEKQQAIPWTPVQPLQYDDPNGTAPPQNTAYPKYRITQTTTMNTSQAP